jgi:hypothetical protein
MCAAQNTTFFQCMQARDEAEPLHMKHVNCYHPHKVALMKCFADEERAKKRAAAAAEAAAGGDGHKPPAA